MSRSRTVLFLLLLVLVGFLLRVGFSMAFQGLNAPPDPNLGLDHIQYAWIAEDMRQGNGYRLPVDLDHANDRPTAFRPPGTPFLIFMLYKITGQEGASVIGPSPAFAVVRLTFAFLGALTLLPLYFTVRTLCGEKPAWIAATLLCFWPAHAYYSMHFFSEVPWTFLLTLVMALGVALCRTPHWWLALLQGLLLGYASLIRPIAFFLPFFQAGLLLLFHPQRKRLFGLGLVSCVVCFLCLVPWGMRNHGHFGQWVFFTTHGGTTFYGCHNEKVMANPELKGRWLPPEQTPQHAYIAAGKGEIERDDRAYEAASAYLEDHLYVLPELIAWKLIRTFHPNPGTPNRIFNHAVGWPWLLLAPFAFAGLFRVFFRSAGAWIPLIAPVLMILLLTVVWYGDHRFRISIAPMWIALAVIGVWGTKQPKGN